MDWSLEAREKQLQLDPARRSRNQCIIERCAQWGQEHGLVRSWTKGRLQQDQRRVKYTLVIAPQRYGAQRPEEASEPERRTLVERFYARLGTKAAGPKLRRDAAIVAQLVADGFSVEEITYAGEWAVQHIPGVMSFGLLPYIMHHALKARHAARQAEAAKHEAAARLQAHRQHQQAEQARAAAGGLPCHLGGGGPGGPRAPGCGGAGRGRRWPRPCGVRSHAQTPAE